MEISRKIFLIARISSGIIRFKIADRRYSIHPTSSEVNYIIEELFQETFASAIEDGLMTEDQLFDFLIDNDLWTESEEKTKDLLLSDIEEYKVKIFERFHSRDERELLRNNLRLSETRLTNLLGKRHAYDHLSALGYAQTVKYKFGFACSIHGTGGPYWKKPLKYFKKKREEEEVIEKALEAVASLRITDSEYRELARTDPWRTIWNCRETAGRGVFDKASADLTDEQRSLLLWSSFYDSIYQSPDRPGEAVVDDDDGLDGYCISQRRKQATETKSRLDGVNKKVAQSDEVFLMAANAEEAKVIEDLNSPIAKAIKQRREMKVRQSGTVYEQEFDDVHNKFMEAVKNKRGY